MPHRSFVIIPIILIAIVFAACGGSGKTDVLVVGTIHQRHASDANYTYADVARILSAYDPDLVCVEIRPEDFRKVPYLKEMMLATIWGLAHGKAVAPIDWWDESENTREVRAKLAEQPEYIEKDKQEKALYAQSPIVARFEKTYGPAEAEAKWSKDFGYDFWNGRDYNEFYAEVYRISMQVYGDSPFNLYYETRNSRMMGLIQKAVRDHRSRRAIVLTGSEHKHYFDRALQKDKNVKVVDFGSLLPLKKMDMDPAVRTFLDEDDDALYYEPGYPLDPDAAYRGKTVPLLHGPNMDVFPDTIPEANIDRAAKIIDRWKAARPESDVLIHETAWLDFLRGEYAQAVPLLLGLAKNVDNGKIADPWQRFAVYLNLGRCYDVLGEREKALESYARSEALLAGTPWERAKDYIFQNYLKVPFKRRQVEKKAG